MHLINIDLSHQEVLTEKLSNLNLEISEYNFSNIYLFRHIHKYQLLYEKELFIKGTTRDGFSYLMPTFAIPDHFSLEEARLWLSEVDFLFPIPEEWLSLFDPNHFEYTYQESESDYLYKIEKMQTYAGRNLSTKRNLVKQLLSDHAVQTAPLNKDNLSEALNILEQWQQNRGDDREEADYEACKEALALFYQLQLSGILLYVDDQPAGFVLGQNNSSVHFLVHFIKAENSIIGVHQYLYQILAQSLKDHHFINLEQDLGSPQIRQAKHSYQPDRMIRKWRVRLKEQSSNKI